MIETDLLLDYITGEYLSSARSGSYNGVAPLRALLEGPVKHDLKAVLVSLVRTNKLDCIWDVNPHIKRLWPASAEEQIEKLERAKLDSFCIYPTEKHLRTVVADAESTDKPFSRRLLLGEPQLNFATFELQALSRYLNDPRYLLNFEDYAGNIGISNEHYESSETRERDRVGLQSFGLAIDENQVPHIVVFLRYLDDLSAEHQQYWNSFQTERVPMCRQYFQSSILGEFWENRCIRNAIKNEISLINAMADANFGKPFFRTELSKEMPLDISAFSVASSENFGRMVHAWDKVLSDNISSKFFPPEIDRSTKNKNKKGEILVQPRGSISRLDEWMRSYCPHEQRASLADDTVGMFAKVRDLRQKPAHDFTENWFSKEFYRERRALLCRIFEGLRALRIAFSAFPESDLVEVPDWLNSNNVEVF